MSDKEKSLKIGFPPPLLGSKPLRLQVYGKGDGWVLLEKPAGLTAEKHPWYPKGPYIMDGLRKQADAKKPELTDLGIEEPHLIYSLAPEESGAILVAGNKGTAEKLSNTYGSSQIGFKFQLIARQRSDLRGVLDALSCDLPIANHFDKPCSVVSNTTGKKCSTSFRFIEDLCKGYSLWEADTQYLRPHQVRLHAHECGLKIIGETLYAHEKHIYLSSFKKGYRLKAGEVEQPLYPYVAIHLSEVLIDGQSVAVNTPKKWNFQLSKLRSASR